MTLATLTGDPILVVNGTQTLSYTCLTLIQEAAELQRMGIETLRMSPQSGDMVQAAGG